MIFIALNVPVLLVVYLFEKVFGEGNFGRIVNRGKYQVGYREFHLESGKNAVSVYYPCDEDAFIAEGPGIAYNRYEAYIENAYKAQAWFLAQTGGVGLKKEFNHYHKVFVPVLENEKIAAEFKDGTKRVIPIILSHGYEESRMSYSTIARELASHGYLVFVLDHHDGSCVYTMDEGLESFWELDYSVKDFFDYETMNGKIKLRENEVNELIDCITKHNFLQTSLGFTKFVKLDPNKVVMAGHSMGGATAIRVGSNNAKINCVLTNDAWLLPINKEIYNNTYRGFTDKKSVFLLNTKTFHDFTKAIDHRHCHSYLRDYTLKKCQNFEDVSIINADHTHQTDKAILNSYEIEWQKWNEMPKDRHMVPQLHAWLWLRFMDRVGYNNSSFDPKDIQSHI